MPNKQKQLTGTSRLSQRKTKITNHPAALDDHPEGSFYKIPIDMIKPNPHQPRQYFDKKALNELAQSIKQNGIIQPLAVQKNTEGNVIILAGERRLRASKIAGLTEVPAVFTGGNPAEIALIENVQRQNLNPIEEAEAYNRMVAEHKYTQEKLAQVVGKSRVIITETLSLNKLPDEIKKECRRVDIFPKRFLIQVARKKTSKEMLKLFSKEIKAYQKREEDKTAAKRKVGTPLSIATKRIMETRAFIEKHDQELFGSTNNVQFIEAAKILRDYLVKILK